MWYRVELNKDGSVKSCAEVEAFAHDGVGVCYVEATDRAGACKLAAAYAHRLAGKVDYKRYQETSRGRPRLCNVCRGVLGEQASRTCKACAARRQLAKRKRDEEREAVRAGQARRAERRAERGAGAVKPAAPCPASAPRTADRGRTVPYDARTLRAVLAFDGTLAELRQWAREELNHAAGAVATA